MCSFMYSFWNYLNIWDSFKANFNLYNYESTLSKFFMYFFYFYWKTYCYVYPTYLTLSRLKQISFVHVNVIKIYERVLIYEFQNTCPKRFVQFEMRATKSAGYEIIFHPSLMWYPSLWLLITLYVPPFLFKVNYKLTFLKSLLIKSSHYEF